METTKQKIYGKGITEFYLDADKLLKDFFLTVLSRKRRPSLDPRNDVIQQYFSWIQFKKYNNNKYKNQ